MKHHPVFYKFPISPSLTASGFQCDFIGSRFRSEYGGGWEGVYRDYPEWNEEYFEWITLLNAVSEARHRFVLIELGAGYGRWEVRAACAARSLGLPFHIVGVEADPSHFRYLCTSMKDNDITSGECTLINAAVSASRGRLPFYVKNAAGDEGAAWYGQRLLRADESAYAAGCECVEIEVLTLLDILDPFATVDLIDMDIEGEELEVVQASIQLLDEKVRRLYIGTHSVEIEKGLRSLLEARGWLCTVDYRTESVAETPYGRISFENGAQGWVNQRKL
jgi:FkbM family methyltransferase